MKLVGNANPTMHGSIERLVKIRRAWGPPSTPAGCVRAVGAFGNISRKAADKRWDRTGHPTCGRHFERRLVEFLLHMNANRQLIPSDLPIMFGMAEIDQADIWIEQVVANC